MKLNFVNIDNEIVMSSSASKNSDFLTADDNTKDVTFQVPTENFFNGTVLSTTMECSEPNDCESLIKFDDHVALQNSAINITGLDLRDISGDSTKTLAQSSSDIFVIDSTDSSKILAIVDISLGGKDLNCNKIAMHGTGFYSASVCGNDISSGNNGYIVIVSYLSSDPVVALYH